MPWLPEDREALNEKGGKVLLFFPLKCMEIKASSANIQCRIRDTYFVHPIAGNPLQTSHFYTRTRYFYKNIPLF